MSSASLDTAVKQVGFLSVRHMTLLILKAAFFGRLGSALRQVCPEPLQPLTDLRLSLVQTKDVKNSKLMTEVISGLMKGSRKGSREAFV